MSAPYLSDVLSHYGHPPVLVLASPTLDTVMKKNYVTFAELLKPFGHPPLLNSAMHFRTLTRGAYQLTRWGVRFVSAIEMEEMEARMGERFLELALQMNAKEGQELRHNDAVGSTAEATRFLNLHPDPVPWYTRYRIEMLNTLRFRDSELIDQPIGLMIAVYAAESNPQQFIESTRNAAKLPSGLQKGIYDLALPRAIVVVHDKHNEAIDPHARNKALELIKVLARAYGTDVLPTLCEINGFPVETPNPSQRDLWSTYVLQGRAMSRYGNGKASKATNSGSDTPIMDVRESGIDSEDTNDALQLLPLNLVDIASQPSTNPDYWRFDRNFVIGQPAAADAFHVFLDQSLSTPLQTARGQFLTPMDLENLGSFVHSFLVKSVLPSVEQRWLNLHEKVSAIRGSLNRLKAGWKSMLGGGKPPVHSFIPNLGTYHLNSPESQARQLADLSYVMQDWETAEQCYSYCIRDYRSEPQRATALWFHLASANEMRALTLAHLDASRHLDAVREHVDAARSIYISLGDHRRAARVAILAAEAYRIRSPTVDRWKEALSLTLKASRREYTVQLRSVRAALMIEYAAYLFLSAPPSSMPCIRKYALCMLISARLYRQFGLKALETRADSCAAIVYNGKHWDEIQGHVQSNLAKEYFQLNRFAASVHSFVQLLNKLDQVDHLTAQPVNILKSNASPDVEQKYLTDLSWVVEQWQLRMGSTKDITDLQLPCFVNESVIVHCNDSITVPNSMSAQAWNASSRIQQRLSIDPTVCNRRLFSPSLTLNRENDRGAVVRELIVVECRVLNPMLFPLNVSDIRLKVKFTSSNAASLSTPAQALIVDYPLPTRISDTQVQQLYPSETAFILFSQNLSLSEQSSTLIKMSVLPLCEGTLVVEGVTWRLGNTLQVQHTFRLPPRALPASGRRGPTQYQADPSLIIPVLPPSSHLLVKLSDTWQSKCFQGEVFQCQLILTNVGELSISQILARVSHPSFALIGHPISHQHQNEFQFFGYNWDDALVPISLSLQAGESVSLPLYIRATTEGIHNFQLLLRYDSSGSNRSRLVYLTNQLTVYSGLNVQVTSKPLLSNVHDSLLAVDVHYPASCSDSLHISSPDAAPAVVHQVTVLSKSWQISPFGKNAQLQISNTSHVVADCHTTMFRGDSLSLLYRVCALPALTLSSPFIQSAVSLQQSHILHSKQMQEAVSVVQSPWLELIAMEKALLMEEERVTLMINPAAQVPDVAAANKLDLLVAYSCGKSLAFVHCPGLTAMRLPSTSCPIKVHVQFPQYVDVTELTNIPLAHVPITISIKNLSEEHNVSVLFETLPIEEEFDAVKRSFKTAQSSQLRGRYLWRGNTRCRVHTISRQSTHQIHLQADILQLGTFNCNRFRFTVDAVGAGRKPRVFFFPIQNLVTITASSEINISQQYLANGVEDPSAHSFSSPIRLDIQQQEHHELHLVEHDSVVDQEITKSTLSDPADDSFQEFASTSADTTL